MCSDRKINIFISYSHRDEKEKEQFVKFLNPIDNIDIDVWVDDKIEAGIEFEPEITSAIERADIAILLISPDFLDSKFIKNKELPRILEKQTEYTLKIFPIIIKSSSWKNVEWVAIRNVRPKNGTPIFERHNINKELEIITNEIVSVAKGILENEKSGKDSQTAKIAIISPPNSRNLDSDIPIILPFSNRVEILANLDPKETSKEGVFQSFVAIDGPAGRGKTELIKEIYQRYKKASWDCALGTMSAPRGETKEEIQISRVSNRQLFISQLAKSLDIIKCMPNDEDFGNLGGQLFVEYEKLRSINTSVSNGLAFFIDWDDEIDQEELKEIIDNFVVRIRQKAKENGFFAADQRKLLFFITGRYLLSYEAISRSNLKFQRISLLPFTYEDVRDALSNHLHEERNSPKVRLLSADILYLSGGHPGLMAKIVSHYERVKHYSIPEFVAKYIKNTWAADLDKTLKEITRGLFEDNLELLDISKEFCIYRYFNKSIAQNILARLGYKEGQKQEYKLSLMKSHGLYQFEGSMYQDGLVSTLLSLSLSIENKQKFKDQCFNAKELCIKEMKDDYLHHKWFLEYIYLSLLQQTTGDNWQSPERRNRAQKNFETDLKQLLFSLKEFSKKKKERSPVLLNMIEQEFDRYKIREEKFGLYNGIDRRKTKTDATKANLRFLVNYVFSDETYIDTYFEEEFIPTILKEVKITLGLGD